MTPKTINPAVRRNLHSKTYFARQAVAAAHRDYASPETVRTATAAALKILIQLQDALKEL